MISLTVLTDRQAAIRGDTMATNWKQLRYGWGAIKTTLITVQHTQADVMNDLETDDDRWERVFKDLNADMERWIQAADRNIDYCKQHEYDCVA